MELGPKSHIWYGFWALIPNWQSKWTLWEMQNRQHGHFGLVVPQHFLLQRPQAYKHYSWADSISL